jgi:hypothetical protein
MPSDAPEPRYWHSSFGFQLRQLDCSRMVGYPETIATYTSDLTKMSLFIFFATNISHPKS